MGHRWQGAAILRRWRGTMGFPTIFRATEAQGRQGQGQRTRWSIQCQPAPTEHHQAGQDAQPSAEAILRCAEQDQAVGGTDCRGPQERRTSATRPAYDSDYMRDLRNRAFEPEQGPLPQSSLPSNPESQRVQCPADGNHCAQAPIVDKPLSSSFGGGGSSGMLGVQHSAQGDLGNVSARNP